MAAPSTNSARHHILVIGGGFAGLNAVKATAKLPVDITLVDRRNFHLFQPLLYQVASGGLSPGEIAAPLRSVMNRFANVRVLMDEVTGFDPANRTVMLAGGPIAYDTLLVAAGAENHYFGHDDWAAHAPGLKTIEDATVMRARILRAFEQAERETDPRRHRQWLRFAVVGAGPTGVELAGAIAEIAQGYDGTEIKTTDGLTIQGILIKQGDPLMMRSQGGITQIIPASQIHLHLGTSQDLFLTAHALAAPFTAAAGF